MHEMARQKADEYHFCDIRAKRSSNFRGKSRCLSINNDDTRNVLQTNDDSQVRSVFLSNIKSLDNSFLITSFEPSGSKGLATELSPMDLLSSKSKCAVPKSVKVSRRSIKIPLSFARVRVPLALPRIRGKATSFQGRRFRKTQAARVKRAG